MKKVKISLALTAFCAVMISVSALAQKSQKFTFANSKMIEKNEWTGKSVKVEGELIGKINVQDMGSLGYTETLVFVQDKGKEVIINVSCKVKYLKYNLLRNLIIFAILCFLTSPPAPLQRRWELYT
ncbi:hypothetical protein, partial [Raineya sp.]